MPIRPHRRADADRIAEILAADWLDGDIDAASEALFVAGEPDVNGFIHMELGDKSDLGAVGIVNLLYVDPRAQRRGLGRALLSEGGKWLSERATGPMVLSAYRDNPFRDAYTAMGGIPVKDVVSDFGAHRLASVLYLWTDPRRVAASQMPRGR